MRYFFAKIVRRFSIIYLYLVIIFAYELIVVETAPVNADDRKIVYPCGDIVGLYVECDGIFVIDTCQIETLNGDLVCPVQGMLETGDYILAINGVSVFTKEDLVTAVSQSNGDVIVLTIERGEDVFQLEATPIQAKNGEYKLGIWVKDDLAGVGTISYVTADGAFGALGHGMSDGETGDLVEIGSGELYYAKIADIDKGEKGNPGQVKGVLYYGDANHLGEVKENTSIGMFGQIDKDNMTDFMIEEQSLEIAYKQEIEVGEAYIISNISGKKEVYDIEITYVDYLSMNANKGLHIKITDPELLELTGGIVQGMSGSPIIQNGKIVGAVTHVLVNDPTKGYGIFIENMLDAAE